MIAVKISSDISKLFNQIEINGTPDKADHITLFYFENSPSINDICEITKIIYDFTKDQKPLKAKIKEISKFPKGKYGFPLVAHIESNDLNKLRAKIAEKFDKSKINYSKKFKDYKPHITLGYCDEEFKSKKLDFEFSINQIALYGGEEGEGLFIDFPFSFGIERIASYTRAYEKICKNI